MKEQDDLIGEVMTRGVEFGQDEIAQTIKSLTDPRMAGGDNPFSGDVYRNRLVRIAGIAVEAGAVMNQDIVKERDYQDQKWGGSGFDDQHSQTDWFGWINEYASGVNRGAKYDFRTRMVKVAALAVAALEAWERQ